MKIGIVIPTFNRCVKLAECLNSVFSQNLNGLDIDLFICVVNDGSRDDTSDYLKRIKRSNFFILNGDSTWFFTKCINRGFEFFNSYDLDFFMILNDDCLLDSSFFSNFCSFANTLSNSNFIVGPLTLTQTSPTLVQSSGVKKLSFFFKREYFVKPFSVYSSKDLVGFRTSLLLPGRGMIFPKSTFIELGGFDSKFLQYHSDEDFCFSALNKNFPIYINFNLILFNDHLLTSESSSFKSPSLRKVFKSIFDPRSRNFIFDRSRIIWRYNSKILFPFLLLFQYLIIFRSSFREKR